MYKFRRTLNVIGEQLASAKGLVFYFAAAVQAVRLMDAAER